MQVSQEEIANTTFVGKSAQDLVKFQDLQGQSHQV
ncbi:hypothetical protein ACI3PH_21010 [Lactococcus lactis]